MTFLELLAVAVQISFQPSDSKVNLNSEESYISCILPGLLGNAESLSLEIQAANTYSQYQGTLKVPTEAMHSKNIRTFNFAMLQADTVVFFLSLTTCRLQYVDILYVAVCKWFTRLWLKP